MIKTKAELDEIVQEERTIYELYQPQIKTSRIKSMLSHNPVYMISKWQEYSRKADWYFDELGRSFTLINRLKYNYYLFMSGRLAERLSLEICTHSIAKGLLVYHYNNVINGGAVIGENLHLHGDNVIGNSGPQDLRCPKIGNNVMMGAGAKVIGNVTIADNIIIGAGAVVVSSFLEPGITIGGVPAKKIK